MQDNKPKEQQKEKNEKKPSGEETIKPAEPVEKTEVKNANAAGQGAIGRTGEKPGPEMNDNLHY